MKSRNEREREKTEKERKEEKEKREKKERIGKRRRRTLCSGFLVPFRSPDIFTHTNLRTSVVMGAHVTGQNPRKGFVVEDLHDSTRGQNSGFITWVLRS